MAEDILKEIAIAVGKFFINPLFYAALLAAILLGYRRVKRERRFFHRRILWGWSEFNGILKESLLHALFITMFSIIIGLVMPIELLQLLIVVTIIGLLSFYFHLLSPGVLLPISFLLFMLFSYFNWELSFYRLNNYDTNGVAVSVALIVGALLIAEGLLIRKYGAKFASPIVETSKRGKKAVAYFTKKVWILPILFLVPGNLFDDFFPYWPQFSLGHDQFSLILFPIVIGFQQKTRKTLPIFFYKQLGRAVTLLGEFILILGLIGYFVPFVAFITIIASIVLRLLISFLFRLREKRDVYVVSPKSNGVTIVAVLPDSPAKKMGLLPGEVIKRVNGVEVHNERELYEALQINAAHCKIEVLNYDNEIRLTQHVVYSHDHFRIGLLLAE